MIIIKAPARRSIPVPIFEELSHLSIDFIVNESEEALDFSLVEGPYEITGQSKILSYIREIGTESRIGWYSLH